MQGKSDKHGEAIVKRVSRKHHDDEHGSAWKVAFADFCLALMCLFLVMWVLAARNEERAQEVMMSGGGSAMGMGQRITQETITSPPGLMIPKEPVPGQHRTPTDATEGDIKPLKTRYESAEDLAELADVIKRLSKEAGLDANLQAQVTPYGLRVLLHDTQERGMFMRGSAIPNERFRRLLRDLGPLFAQIDNQLLVVGHTDAVPYQGDEQHGAYSNWSLSNHRAMSARAQLMGGGMPSDRVLQVVGMADRAPFHPEDPRADVNRRIELLILTPSQASNVAAMFGMPEHTQALNQDVHAVTRDPAAIRSLKPATRTPEAP